VVTFCRWPRDLQRLDQITAKEKRDIRLLGVSGSALMCHGGAESIRIKSEGEPHHRLHPTQSSLHQLLKPVLHCQPISSTLLFNRHASYQGCPDPCGRGFRHRHSLLQQCQSMQWCLCHLLERRSRLLLFHPVVPVFGSWFPCHPYRLENPRTHVRWRQMFDSHRIRGSVVRPYRHVH
jgi:hypothetical protein